MGCVLSGISLALFSPFVTLRKISYMGEALSHIAFAGIALALFFGLNIHITTLIFVVVISLLIGIVSKRFKLDEANTITIFLSVSMSIGIILISLKNDYTFDLASYLFGNVLLIGKADIVQLVVLSAINLFFILFFYKELFYLTYNAEIAKVYRIRVTVVNYLFLILLAVNIVVNLKIAGIILVSAQLILPAVIAFNIAKRFTWAIVVGVIVSIVSAGIGFLLSWLFNLPTGASIVVFEFCLYVLSLIFKRH